ncbi:hypothetical protein YTPLAS73_13460 [Nitrosarchaeum sp.]|nr:hypothetical protein YTPLAS73_13460 [Nitrosarchaeum sp.]
MSIPISAFAEPMIELGTAQSEIHSLDSVLVIGKVRDVAVFKPITLTVISPDGEIVYAPQLSFDKDGVFKRLFHPTLPAFKDGTYTVIASHPDTTKTAEIQFTVIGSTIPPKGIPVKSSDFGTIPTKPSVITLSADTEFGSDRILVRGSTTSSVTDITVVVTSPQGNLISIAQITPDAAGKFTTEIKSGGPLWKENGFYTITANQGLSSEHKQSIKIEIDNGVVVPEFGTIAVMILAVAIISIIAVSARSRLSVMPRF